MVVPDAQTRSARVRSPNYPVISLGEAVQKVRMVYQAEHMRPATREVVAKALGYRSLNGASATVVSALVKYGLMEYAGDHLKISSDGQDVAVHRKGDPEYAEALRRAALLPALFRELVDRYGASLPSDHNLRAYLQKRGFNPRFVDSVIRVYRDTVQFVEDETDSLDPSLPDDGLDGVLMQQTPVGPGVSVGYNSAPSSSSGPPSPQQGTEVRIPISLDQWVTVRASSPLDEAGWTRFLAGLEFMKPGLVAPETGMASPFGNSPASAPSPEPPGGRDGSSTLTPEAEDLLSKMGSGSVPAYMTSNLERVARDNGIDVTASSTPNQVIDELRERSAG